MILPDENFYAYDFDEDSGDKFNTKNLEFGEIERLILDNLKSGRWWFWNQHEAYYQPVQMNYEQGVSLRKHISHILDYMSENLTYFNTEVFQK